MAQELEEDARRYPEERGEILLEAAEAWRQAGDLDRSSAVLAELIATDGADVCFARCALAENHFDAGADDEAYAELDRLSREPGLDYGACQVTAELLAARGDLAAAAQWYDRSVARLTPETIEKLRGPNGWMQMASIMLRGRSDVRRKLGLPPDAMDELAPTPPPLEQPLDVEQIHDRVVAGLIPRQVRMAVFQRAERAEARRQWPQAHQDTDEEYFPAAERRWRDLAAEGTPSIRVVPVTVAELVAFAARTGGDPIDSAVKSAYAQTVPERDTIAWPPQRNAACWCGSGAKYKKCCGRPG